MESISTTVCESAPSKLHSLLRRLTSRHHVAIDAIANDGAVNVGHQAFRKTTQLPAYYS